jgi:polysaccharide biosynthesis protein PelA
MVGRLFTLGMAMALVIIPGLLRADAISFLNEVPRKVLALYQFLPSPGEETMEEQYVDSSLHRHAEVILNHLGIDLRYHEVGDPLPSDEEMKGFRGIITWFEQLNTLPEPEVYCKWAEKQIQRGLKLVILGNPGFFHDQARVIPIPCQKMLEAMGIRYQGNYSDNPYYFKILKKDPSMVEFERKLLLTEGHDFSHFEAFSPQAKVYLKIGRRDQKEVVSDMILTTPQGGFVHPSYVYFKIKAMDKTHWRINPFRFFEEAFQLKGLPRPDTTTINGRRIFYSHIDGDGILNKSHIDHKSYSGEMIFKEVLKKYSTLPVTASLITGYFDMPEYQHEKVQKMYRDILGLPNIEVASHGHAHPLIWRKGKLALNVPGYDFTGKKEIVGSVEKMRELLKKSQIDKPVDLFLWTGDCRPTEGQIFQTYNNKLLNMNGGDSRFDRRYDSFAYLLPLGLRWGDYLQVYSSNSNENTYTNEWKGPYYGFSFVAETFENTENPIRIKPINIYYHYYSGEAMAALIAVKKAYDYVLTQEVFPIVASEYARIVTDFFSVRFAPLHGGGIQVLNDGSLKTIRFDGETRNLDLNRSKGVIGFRHFQGNLYIFLDDRLSHDLYLTQSRPNKPYVMQSSFHIRKFKADKMKVHFEKRGWAPSEISLGGMWPTTNYLVHVGKETLTLKSNARGELHIQFSSSEGFGEFVPVWIAKRYF